MLEYCVLQIKYHNTIQNRDMLVKHWMSLHNNSSRSEFKTWCESTFDLQKNIVSQLLHSWVKINPKDTNPTKRKSSVKKRKMTKGYITYLIYDVNSHVDIVYIV